MCVSLPLFLIRDFWKVPKKQGYSLPVLYFHIVRLPSSLTTTALLGGGHTSPIPTCPGHRVAEAPVTHRQQVTLWIPRPPAAPPSPPNTDHCHHVPDPRQPCRGRHRHQHSACQRANVCVQCSLPALSLRPAEQSSRLQCERRAVLQCFATLDPRGRKREREQTRWPWGSLRGLDQAERADALL